MSKHTCKDMNGNELSPGDRILASGDKAVVVRIIPPDKKGRGQYIAEYDDGWGDPEDGDLNRCYGFNAKKIDS